MWCDSFHRNAEYAVRPLQRKFRLRSHYQTDEAETRRIDLCAACAREHGVDDPTGFSLANLLAALDESPKGRKKG